MTDLNGTYEIGERMRLFVDGDLREPFVATVEAEGVSGPGHRYKVTARDDFGNELTAVTLERDELHEFLAERGVAP